MQDNHARSSRPRRPSRVRWPLGAAPLIRRASAQPAARCLAAARRALREGEARGRGHDLGAGLAISGVDSRRSSPSASRRSRSPWLGDQQASSRLIAEQRAGRHATDVWTFSLGGHARGPEARASWKNTTGASSGAQDREHLLGRRGRL